MATDVEKMLEDYYAAWNSHDVEKAASFFTDDLVYEDVPMAAVQRNKKEFKDSWNTFFTTCPDSSWKSRLSLRLTPGRVVNGS